MKILMISLIHKSTLMKNVQSLFQKNSFNMTLNIYSQTKYVFCAVALCSAMVYAMANTQYPRTVIKSA